MTRTVQTLPGRQNEARVRPSAKNLRNKKSVNDNRTSAGMRAGQAGTPTRPLQSSQRRQRFGQFNSLNP